ncbi:hypothetical protein HMPREF9104_02067, partial [Lentilactobacillus kisonensis F0435]
MEVSALRSCPTKLSERNKAVYNRGVSLLQEKFLGLEFFVRGAYAQIVALRSCPIISERSKAVRNR